MAQTDYYTVEYKLELENGSVLTYPVEINRETLISRVTTTAPYPEWTKVEPDKCSGCPEGDGIYCPIAIRLVEPIRLFSSIVSHMKALTTVTTEERIYVKNVDAQDALRSLFGLIMATSGCPLMQPFRFMARYHLPFATVEETISRITSAYLLGQFFKNPGATSIPADLKDIEHLYNTIQTLNEGMARRLKKVAESDSSINAIVILNSYSSLIPIIIKDELQKLKERFGKL